MNRSTGVPSKGESILKIVVGIGLIWFGGSYGAACAIPIIMGLSCLVVGIIDLIRS